MWRLIRVKLLKKTVTGITKSVSRVIGLRPLPSDNEAQLLMKERRFSSKQTALGDCFAQLFTRQPKNYMTE